MIAKLDKLSEMAKLLSVKNDVYANLMTYFGQLQLGRMLSRLSLEKQQGVSAVQLILSLCMFRIMDESIHAVYKKGFYGLLETGKNCYYRMLNRETMDWRKLLFRVACRFLAVIHRQKAEEIHQVRCFIIDDTTLEKTGYKMERAGIVHDHVDGRYVLGFKLLLLALFDGRSTIPVDFSIHREKGTKGDYGLTKEQRKAQFKKQRKEGCPAKQRLEESDKSKVEMAIEMLRRAYREGMRADLVLTDSWFTHEWFISEIRKIGAGALHFVGLAKMGNTKYLVGGHRRTAGELVARYEREHTHDCRKYKCRYITLSGMLGQQPVRIFLIKYGRARNWNVLLTSDTRMSFVKAFEAYQIRWNIEVLNKETKQYLGLGAYQGRDFDGLIADCTLCYVTYTVLALEQRFTQYETMGELFRKEREDLIALTLWKRTLACLKRLLEVLAERLGLDFEDLLMQIVSDEQAAREYQVMAEALQKLRDEDRQAA